VTRVEELGDDGRADPAGRAEPAASLAAETGTAVFKVAFARWISEPGQPDLPGIIRESMGELRGVLADRASV